MENNGNKEAGIYVHIPFCDHKCIYCDFYSIIKNTEKEDFLEVIKKEIEHYSALYSKGRDFSTIFFGGGTPSLMTPEYISEIISTLKKYYNVLPTAEITLETNPGTVDSGKLSEFRSVGINRLSIGIQSFDNKDLAFLTRIHDDKLAIQTVHNAAAAGFNNINIDLIFSLPKQTLKKWKKNLEIAVSLPIQHISAYSLILEKGTILNKMVLEGRVKLQGENNDVRLYNETIEYLTATGFNQYEVSNFSKKGYNCRHNELYWEQKEYLGFGTSAHSFMENKRWWNARALYLYLDRVKRRGEAVLNSELLNSSELLDEYIMLALRGKGLLKKEFVQLFGQQDYSNLEKKLLPYIKQGYLTKNEEKISMTKLGYPLCDEIILQIL